jgi:hypothetical protein
MTISKDAQKQCRVIEDRNLPPHDNSLHTAEEIKEIVIIVRLNLYNQGLLYGAKVIRQQLENIQVKPLPSLRAINRILNRHGLTHQRTGHYVPSEKYSR